MMNSELVARARELGQAALRAGVSVSTAESCTGGGIAFYITAIPGSSGWFDRGFVTYTAQAKASVLGVPEDTIAQFGVVSEPVVRAMACGALERSDAQLSVAVSGIAGPGGAEPGKPVGTVCLGYAWRKAGELFSQSETRHFPGDRGEVRDRTIDTALCELLRLIESRFLAG